MIGSDLEKMYGVRCGICDGLFAGVGPGREWVHDSQACAVETLPKLKDRIAVLEKMLQAKSAFVDELAIAAGYFPGEAITATALIARLKHGD